MQLTHQALLLTRDRDSARDVTAACESITEAEVKLSLIPDLEGLQAALGNRSIPLALIDLDPDPRATLARIGSLFESYPDTKLVFLCSEAPPDVLLLGMQMGARDCLAKGVIAKDLPAVIRRLTRGSARNGTGGRLVTVFSGAGGCGATTLAINLAAEMHLASQESALVVDLDAHYGAVSTYLGIGGSYGVADVLSHAMEVDPHLVRSTAAVYDDNLHVLISPASVDFSGPRALDFAQLPDTLRACRNAYPITVVDAPRVPMDVAAALARASTASMVVMELDVVSVRTARHLLRALRERDVPLDSLMGVVNRYRKRSRSLTLDDVGDALEGCAVKLVRNDYTSACKAANFGQPLAKAAPRSTIRRDVRDLAAGLLALRGAGEAA
jgi:pilus assembly protein CpaE